METIRRHVKKLKTLLYSRTAGTLLYSDKWSIGLTVVIAVLTTATLYKFDLVPSNIAAGLDVALAARETGSWQRVRTSSPAVRERLETSLPSDEALIIIPDIGVKAPVVMPRSTDLDTLNNALLKGVVHYPASATPGEEGAVLMFGHSTGLAVVHNQNFAVFNRFKELKPGNIIRVPYGSREYWYKVTSLKIKKADDVLIDLDDKRRRLILSTCRIFGAKDDRYVVEAEFMKSYPLRDLASAADSSS